MNIKNNKISGRQLGRMTFYDFFALTTLLLPEMLAKTTGMDGFFALAAGFAAGYAFLLLVLEQIKRMQRQGQKYQEYLSGRFGKLLTVLILLVYLLTALFGAAYGVRLLCDIIRQYLIRDTSAWLVTIVIILLAIYGLWKGVESRGRMYELLFWFVVLPLLFLFLLTAYNVEPDWWVPVFCAEGMQFLKNSYLVFAFLMSSAFLPIYAEHLSAEHADTARVLKQSFLLSAGINLVLYLLLTGIFGVPTVAAMEEATLELTAMVKVPGGFLERQDALLCGIWLVSLFAFVENALWSVVWCLERCVKQGFDRCAEKRSGASSYEKDHMRVRSLLVAGVVLYVLALGMERSGAFTEELSCCYARLAVPVLFGIMLVEGVLPVWKKRKKHVKKSMCREEADR